MQILVQNNRVVDYCSADSYICFGSFVTCESKNKTFYDCTIVTLINTELPSDIDSSEYLYIEGSFIRVGAKVVTKVNGITPVDGNVSLYDEENPIPIEFGGHGGKTLEEARTNLQLNLKTYTTFEQLGFTTTPTLTELLNKLPTYSKFVRYISATDVSNLEMGSGPDCGVLEITKGQYIDVATLTVQRFGGDSYIRRMWYENWSRGQTKFQWKCIENSDMTAIASGADLNSFTNAGKFTCWLTDTAKSLANNPMSDKTTGIVLEVFEQNNYVFQFVYGTLLRGMYVRRRNSNKEWNDWMNINNGIKEAYLSKSSGYATFENALVIAWKNVSLAQNAWTTVTKPTSFTTYVALGVHTQGTPDGQAGRCYGVTWDKANTTTTSDKFTTDSNNVTAAIIWIGYKV